MFDLLENKFLSNIKMALLQPYKTKIYNIRDDCDFNNDGDLVNISQPVCFLSA